MQYSTCILVLFALCCVTIVQSKMYSVIVMTGYFETKSRVDIRFVGDRGTSSAHELVQWPPGNYFHSNGKNRFRINAEDVGNLRAVEVYLYSGYSWSVNKILVMTDSMHMFVYNREVYPRRWTRITESCPSGFERDSSGNCVDKDECKNSPCTGPTARCMNTVGSYRCKCSDGYKLHSNTRCEDINECLTANECKGYCSNTPGSYKCTCRSGFKVVQGTKCVDLDECEEGVDNCDRQTTNCVNVKNGGRFYCTCKTGYKYVDGTRCTKRYCKSLLHQFDNDRMVSTVQPPRCLKNNANWYKDICTPVCKYGYELRKGSTMTCQSTGYWSRRSSDLACIGVKCPPLPGCTLYGGRHGDYYNGTCFQNNCPKNYKLVGTLKRFCQADGTWSASKKQCYLFPKISCPLTPGIWVDLPLGKNTTSLGSKLKIPTANFKNITVNPPGVDQNYQFPYGYTLVTWTVKNEIGLTDSCSQAVNVRDRERPTVKYCPGPVIYHPASSNDTFVRFKEPVFTDNVGVKSVEPNYTGGYKIGNGGKYNVNFMASDKSNNIAFCAFSIQNGASKCSKYPDSKGYPGSFRPFDYNPSRNKYRVKYALKFCPWPTVPFANYKHNTYTCVESTGLWDKEDSDCVGYFQSNKTAKCSEGYVKVAVYSIDHKCFQCPIGNFYTKVNGTGTCKKCPAGTYQDKRASTSCKKCPQGKSSNQGDHVCKDLCPRGTFSKDGMRPFCSLCPQGQYQPKEGQTSCLDCQTFTNTKLASFSCGAVKPTMSTDLPVIERIVKPRVLNLTSSEAANVFECYIKDNNYEQVAVKWEVKDNGVPDDFFGHRKYEEITNKAGKVVGSRLTITRAKMYNPKGSYVCEVANPNGQVKNEFTLPKQLLQQN